jgi:orotidine-5'-phosphate decarboxylase
MKGKDRLLVALDVPPLLAESFVVKLKDKVGGFKVNIVLFTILGPAFVRQILDAGLELFLDLKFHDIPNTVEGAARSAAEIGVRMFNIHCSGGEDMMMAAVEGVRIGAPCDRPKPLVIGVTMLTSLDEDSLLKVGLRPVENLKQTVMDMAKLAQKCGLDGVVASPKETATLRLLFGSDFVIINPGIRMAGGDANDQKRLDTPFNAIRAGADYLVVGRPITEASDPAAAAEQFVAEIKRAEADAATGAC